MPSTAQSSIVDPERALSAELAPETLSEKSYGASRISISPRPSSQFASSARLPSESRAPATRPRCRPAHPLPPARAGSSEPCSDRCGVPSPLTVPSAPIGAVAPAPAIDACPSSARSSVGPGLLSRTFVAPFAPVHQWIQSPIPSGSAWPISGPIWPYSGVRGVDPLGRSQLALLGRSGLDPSGRSHADLIGRSVAANSQRFFDSEA